MPWAAEDIAVGAAESVKSVTGFGADRCIHQRPAGRRPNQNQGHDETEEKLQPPKQPEDGRADERQPPEKASDQAEDPKDADARRRQERGGHVRRKILAAKTSARKREKSWYRGPARRPRCGTSLPRRRPKRTAPTTDASRQTSFGPKWRRLAGSYARGRRASARAAGRSPSRRQRGRAATTDSAEPSPGRRHRSDRLRPLVPAERDIDIVGWRRKGDARRQRSPHAKSTTATDPSSSIRRSIAVRNTRKRRTHGNVRLQSIFANSTECSGIRLCRTDDGIRELPGNGHYSRSTSSPKQGVSDHSETCGATRFGSGHQELK